MANEGYIPYGLDRSSKWRGDIQGSRDRQRNATIRGATEPGEILNRTLNTAMDDGMLIKESFERDQLADARVKTQKQARIREAERNVQSSNLMIEQLNSQIGKTTKNTELYFDLQRQLIEQRGKRDTWQSAVDSYVKEENANSQAQLASNRTKTAEAGALSAQMIAAKKIVEDTIGPSQVEEVEDVETVEVGDQATAWTDDETSVFGNIDGPLSRLSAPTMGGGGLGTRNIGLTPGGIIGTGSIRGEAVEDVSLSEKSNPTMPSNKLTKDSLLDFYRRGG